MKSRTLYKYCIHLKKRLDLQGNYATSFILHHSYLPHEFYEYIENVAAVSNPTCRVAMQKWQKKIV
jgi:hypothetical protein